MKCGNQITHLKPSSLVENKIPVRPNEWLNGEILIIFISQSWLIQHLQHIIGVYRWGNINANRVHLFYMCQSRIITQISSLLYHVSCILLLNQGSYCFLLHCNQSCEASDYQVSKVHWETDSRPHSQWQSTMMVYINVSSHTVGSLYFRGNSWVLQQMWASMTVAWGLG